MSGKPDLVTLASEIVGCCENVAVRKHSMKMLGEKSMQLVNLLQEESQSLGAATQTWLEDTSSLLRGILKHIRKWSSRGSVVQWWNNVNVVAILFLKRKIERHHQDLDTAIRSIRSGAASESVVSKEPKVTIDSTLNTLSNMLSIPEKSKALQEQNDDRAQLLIDFMYAALSQPVGRPPEPQLCKVILAALCRLAEASTLYPHWYVLKNITHHPYEDAGRGFCDIHRGNHNGADLCLKIVRVNQPAQVDKMFKIHAKELILWGQLRHANVVPFYGVHYLDATRKQICLVTPWMDNGNLVAYLGRNPTVHRKPFISDIAHGLRYLQDENVIHGDLKGANILVNDSGRACITDFGLSAIWTDRTLGFAYMTSGTVDGSIRWAAPELFEEGALPSQASDIWAFGCVCYEVLTGRLPFHECSRDYQIVRKLLDGERPAQAGEDIDSNSPDVVGDAMWNLMNRCWSLEPRERATCQDILQEFELGVTVDEDGNLADQGQTGPGQGNQCTLFSMEDNPFTTVDLVKVQEVLAEL